MTIIQQKKILIALLLGLCLTAILVIWVSQPAPEVRGKGSPRPLETTLSQAQNHRPDYCFG